MSLKEHKRADKIKWIITFTLIALLLIGSTFAIVKLVRNETTLSVRPSAYEIGSLDTAGEEVKNIGYIRMKQAVSVDGLKIEVAEEAEIKYQVFYYSVDEDGKETFVSASEVLSADLNAESIPATADVCKVVIQPTMDAEVGVFEINDYARQLSVTYNK